jgi:hypothetical protein
MFDSCSFFTLLDRLRSLNMAMIHPDDQDFSKTEPVKIAQVRSRRRLIHMGLSVHSDIHLI